MKRYAIVNLNGISIEGLGDWESLDAAFNEAVNLLAQGSSTKIVQLPYQLGEEIFEEQDVYTLQYHG